MNNLETILLPYIFMALFGFIVLNLLMSLCLYSFSKKESLKLLCWYWGTLLITYVFQGFFQEGQLSIILSYSSNIVPILIMSKILFETMEKKSPIKGFLGVWFLALVLTPVLHYLGYSFTSVSMPLSIAMGLIPLVTASELLLKQNNRTSYLQKLIGIMMLAATLHFINFSLFRNNPGAQLWGWAVAFGLYQVFSVLLFALVIENQARQENEGLQKLVDQKTHELTSSLKTKEMLFRMVLHDIATPIQGQLLIISNLKKSQANLEEKGHLLNRLSELTGIIKKVVEKVRSIETVTSGKLQMELSPISFDTCVEDVRVVFENQLKAKNISLEIINDLADGTKIFADQTSFTTSVLGNLISNAIKFSPANSTLFLHAFEKDNKVKIEVLDQGVGIPEALTFSIFDPIQRNSRPGTEGEIGTGFGMTQVKSFMEHFGGQIEIESRPRETYPQNHGTKITLTMEKTSSGLH